MARLTKNRLVRLLFVLGVVFVLVILGDIFSLGDYYKRGKILFYNKQYQRAIPLFEIEYKRNNSISGYALYYLAEAHFQFENYGEAKKYFSQYVKSFLEGPFLEKSKFRLVEISLKQGFQLTIEEKFIEAVGLYNERKYGPAGEKFRVFCLLYPRFEKIGEAYHYLGLCNFFLKNYSSALASFNTALAHKQAYYVKTLWWSAKAYQERRLYKSALARYAQIYNSYPKDELAPSALAAAAEVYSDIHWYKYSRNINALLRRNYPDHYLAGVSYWKDAWNYYAINQYYSAYQLFAEGNIKLPNNSYAAALGFWAGKAAQKLGWAAAAKKHFEDTMKYYDHNYYAYRSAQLLGFSLPPISKKAYTFRIPKRTWNQTYRSLLRQGAFDDAYLEIEEKLAESDETTKGETYLELAKTAAAQGFIFESINFLEKYLNLRLVLPSQLDLYFWKRVYPQPFQGQAERFGKKYGIESALIHGLMREESGFRPEVISNAGAVGLMQLMPKTAQAELQLSTLPLQMLYEPKLNIQVGTLYYAKQFKNFKRHELALAAYNAGPQRVNYWLRLRRIKDFDEWIEYIPYSETRNYVKRVMRSYWEYQRIYGD